MSHFEKAKSFFEEYYDVTLEVVELSSTDSPTVTLLFKDKHTTSIENVLSRLGFNELKLKLDGLKITVENKAKMEQFVFPYDSIQNIKLLKKQPYQFELQANLPYARVLCDVLLSQYSDSKI